MSHKATPPPPLADAIQAASDDLLAMSKAPTPPAAGRLLLIATRLALMVNPARRMERTLDEILANAQEEANAAEAHARRQRIIATLFSPRGLQAGG